MVRASTRVPSHLRMFVLLAACLLGTTGGVRCEDYRLGPQDRVQIKVYDWRSRNGEEHQWAALSGEFQVGGSGEMLLPLIGELQAEGQTVAGLATMISQHLQAKVGLAEAPNSSVEIVKYRPFYIVSGVDKPGEYNYRPGLTVLQAIALAGGLPRLADVGAMAVERERLLTRGDLRMFADERLQLLARRARIDAQLSGRTEIRVPDELRPVGNDDFLVRIVREETTLFKASTDGLKSKIETLKQSRLLGQKEIDSLKSKGETLARQLDLAKTELSQVSGLMSRGLAVTSRVLALEQSISQFESGQLDIQLASLRSQQDIARLDREILAAQDTYTIETLRESRDVRARLAEIEEKIATSTNLLRNSDMQASGIPSDSTEGAMSLFNVSITRKTGNDTRVLAADINTAVNPGDSLIVMRKPTERSAFNRN